MLLHRLVLFYAYISGVFTECVVGIRQMHALPVGKPVTGEVTDAEQQTDVGSAPREAVLWPHGGPQVPQAEERAEGGQY